MRISYFDFLRSVAILMVVFIHCFGFCYTSSDISIPVIIVRNLMNVAVPLFFAISGYFLASKQMENGGYVQFLKRQIPRVYIPVLFCSLFFLFGDLSSGFSLKPFIKFFSCGYSVYYFIAVIIQCYLLLWFLKKHVSLFSLKVLIFLGLIWWSIIHYLLGIYMGRTVPLILYAGNFVPWGLFFVEGLYFGSRKNATESLKLSVIVGLSIVLFVLSVVESYFIMEKTQTLQGLGQKASIFCFNAFLCMIALRENTKKWFLHFEHNKIYQLSCIVGRYSLGIYLIHWFILSKIVLFEDYIAVPFFKWIVDSLIVFVLCFVLLLGCKKITPKFSHILLGV